ncbi:DUF4350 domain-containing protein [Microbacterium sp. SYP-A9085]|uniref:DUF4350 domain-containing protein n=1 Tax=Microbacterium sp. SYP-A9085 TaxID=2664454 RepID=UPI00129B3911|nr:DUF4350 domain-containing protein [Microbacterium sp. SYP-A9085]MRH28888.1 DUF4350 domain-containing protein [Microbacterium sp. SYP-A9085]
MTATVPARADTTTRRKRATAWVAITVVLVAAGIGGAVLSGLGQWTQRNLLDPQSAGPDGARALARILSDHGVDVRIARDRGAVRDQLRSVGGAAGIPAAATLVLPDSPLLSDPTFQRLADTAADVVVIQPQSRGVRVLFGADTAGYGADAPVPAACALAAAQRAGSILPGTLYTVPAGGTATGCYRVGHDVALLQRTSAGSTATAVDGTELFTNATLARGGNAALAVNLLGAHRTLVWYVPSASDADAAPLTLGQLTPSWASPVILLLLVAGVAAGVWRGRRFGPLVAENLPVTVRTAETTDGRARLYARSGDVVHVADRLRIGTLTRLARMLGLGAAADAGAVSDAVADLLGMPRAGVRGILIDTVPTTDRELLALSDRLRDLERAVHAALRPNDPTDSGRNRP